MNRFLTTACVLLIASVGAIAAAPLRQNARAEPVAAQQDDELARVGEETAKRVCSECHDLREVTNTRRTPRDWSEMVGAMADRGATATEDEFGILRRYLPRYFGLVPINTASAQDLSAVLGLSAKDAETIVDYRTKNGRFADAAALLNVPGIDRTKIDAQPEALRFN